MGSEFLSTYAGIAIRHMPRKQTPISRVLSRVAEIILTTVWVALYANAFGKRLVLYVKQADLATNCSNSSLVVTFYTVQECDGHTTAFLRMPTEARLQLPRLLYDSWSSAHQWHLSGRQEPDRPS